jgi:hypothetical protein
MKVVAHSCIMAYRVRCEGMSGVKYNGSPSSGKLKRRKSFDQERVNIW